MSEFAAPFSIPPRQGGRKEFSFLLLLLSLSFFLSLSLSPLSPSGLVGCPSPSLLKILHAKFKSALSPLGKLETFFLLFGEEEEVED